MKKIYIIQIYTGEEYYTYSNCYSIKKQAERMIKKLQQNKEIVEKAGIQFCDFEDIKYWIEEINLIPSKKLLTNS